MSLGTTRLRALTVIRHARLEDAGPLRPASSANEVWHAGPYVIRISSDVGSGRLHYEAEVAARLPPEVPYPKIVRVGRATFGEWMVVWRSPGEVLSRLWPLMDDAERRCAVEQVAAALEALHAAPAPDTMPPFLAHDTLECPHQLPPRRLLTLLERAATLRFVDPGLIEDARDLVAELADAWEGPGDRLVHGDLHFENVIWDGERVSALLDLEWARAAPADLDLDVFLRFCADPSLHVVADYEHLAVREHYRDVPRWFREAYPALFSHPRLHDRLTLYGLAYDVRHLLVHRPTAPPDRIPQYHPYHRIKRWVDGRSHISWMEL